MELGKRVPGHVGGQPHWRFLKHHLEQSLQRQAGRQMPRRRTWKLPKAGTHIGQDASRGGATPASWAFYPHGCQRANQAKWAEPSPGGDRKRSRTPSILPQDRWCQVPRQVGWDRRPVAGRGDDFGAGVLPQWGPRGAGVGRGRDRREHPGSRGRRAMG